MVNARRFDLIVVGSGTGEDVAVEAANHGMKTAIVEKGPLGGTCLNRGCIPSKMLMHSADLIEQIRSAATFGIKISGYEADFQSIVKRVNGYVDGESNGIEHALEGSDNPVLYHTEGAFTGPKTLRVGKETITADKILIAAGARPSVPDMPGLKESGFITSEGALRLRRQPKVMTIIGGGYIATELAHFYGALGTKINIVHRNDVLVNREDREIAQRLTEVFRRKYNVYTNSEPVMVTKTGAAFGVETKSKDGSSRVLKSDALLVATGITPNSDTLRLDKAGVKTNEKGYIVVDDYLRTSTPGVYALGDIIGKYPFKHAANLEGEYAAANIIYGKEIPVDYAVMPHAIFTSPQIGSVGRTEEQLKADGVDYLVGRYNYIDTAMGAAIDDKDGFVKFLVERGSNRILGCHIIGTDAATLVHETVIAMKSGDGSLDNIARAVHIHPALNEVVSRASYSVG